MKKRITRPLAAIMAAVLLVSALAGCNNNTEDPNNPNGGAATPEFVYVAEYINLADDIEDMSNLCAVGDKLYFSSQIMTDEETGTYATKLYSMDIDGANLTELAGYKPMDTPEGAMGNMYINSMLSDGEGNLWVAESGNFYGYNLPEDFNEATDDMWQYYYEIGNEVAVRKLDSSGAELLSVDISGLASEAEYFYLNTFSIDSNDNIYLAVDTIIYVLNSAGELQFKLEVMNWVERLLTMPDGSVAFFGYSENGQVLRKIDFAAKTWGEEIEMPRNAYNLYPGGGDYSLVFSDSSNLYGLDSSTNETVKLLNWIDSDISNDGMGNITILPDGRVMCTSYTWDNATESSKFELIVLTKTPYDSTQQRTVLTLATMWLDWNLRSAIVNFNKTNDTYRIKVNDYSEFSTDEDYMAGLTKLSTEIISGNIPDILDVSNLPYKQYVGKGLLEDLYAYIDADPEISRDKLMESALKATEMNGGLYQIFPHFGVTSLIGSPSVLGEEMGWNMDEFRAVLEANPQASSPMGQYITKTDFLRYIFMMNMDEYVNWSTGKCNFDGGDFAALLEFANVFPEEYNYDEDNFVDEYELIANGQQIMMPFGVSDFQSIQMYTAMFGGEIVFKGFPTQSRNGNVLTTGSGIAMTTKCADKEGAWEFMRTILNEDWQRSNVSWNFPTNKVVFDEMLKKAMTPEYETDADGNEVEISRGGWGYGRSGQMIEIYAMTQEEADQLLALIDSVSGTVSYDESLLTIINEGAADYFSGQKSAQEAAGVVQSRASVYVSERS